MSHARTTSILSGGALLTLAILGFMARQFQLGPYDDSFAALSDSMFYGIIGIIAVAGSLLLVFAPSARRSQRRVRLDAPGQAGMQLRPSARTDTPQTQGLATTQVDGQGKGTPASASSAGGGPAASPAPHASPSGAARTGPGTPSWAHPNAAQAETTVDPTPAYEESTVDVRVTPQKPEQLQQRIDELERRASNAKVRYGLGQLSGTGYRQVLARIDEERGKLEQELLQGELDF